MSSISTESVSAMTIISFGLSQNIILCEIHENQLYDTHQARVRPKSFCIGQNFDRCMLTSFHQSIMQLYCSPYPATASILSLHSDWQSQMQRSIQSHIGQTLWITLKMEQIFSINQTLIYMSDPQIKMRCYLSWKHFARLITNFQII